MKKSLFFAPLFLLIGCSNTEIEKTDMRDIHSQENSISAVSENFGIQEVKKIEEKIIYDERSLPTLMDEDIVGNDLKIEGILSENINYTRYQISYMSGDLRISGIMNIPKGDGPFPLIILAHGYIDINYYTNGRGLKREQDYFANNGFAVIHPDYRNHAFSDKISEEPYDFRLGYTRDVIASILAAQSSDIPELSSVDTQKVGLLGHSMGGGISQNISVVRPDLIDALILYAPVSNQEYKNFMQFQVAENDRNERVNQVFKDYGNYEENPDFWNGVSSYSFLENVSVPVQIYSGTDDESTPHQWSQDIKNDLESYEKEVELIMFQNEKHEFTTQWQNFIQGATTFFSEKL